MHPKLEHLRSRRLHGSDTATVVWAVDRMTTDFSLHDVSKLLAREGYALKNAKISVVLTRLQRQGRIHMIQPGSGPIPARFRQPESAIPAAADDSDALGSSEEVALSTAA